MLAEFGGRLADWPVPADELGRHAADAPPARVDCVDQAPSLIHESVLCNRWHAKNLSDSWLDLDTRPRAAHDPGLGEPTGLTITGSRVYGCAIHELYGVGTPSPRNHSACRAASRPTACQAHRREATGAMRARPRRARAPRSL